MSRHQRACLCRHLLPCRKFSSPDRERFLTACQRAELQSVVIQRRTQAESRARQIDSSIRQRLRSQTGQVGQTPNPGATAASGREGPGQRSEGSLRRPPASASATALPPGTLARLRSSVSSLPGAAVQSRQSSARNVRPVRPVQTGPRQLTRTATLSTILRSDGVSELRRNRPTASYPLGTWGEERLALHLDSRGEKPAKPFRTSLGLRYPDRVVGRTFHEYPKPEEM